MPNNRAQRRRIETHGRLFDALRAEIAANGLEATTVQAVTERADVALGTFYNHFDHKDTAIAALSQLELSSMKSAAATVDGHVNELPRLITTAICLIASRGSSDREWIKFLGAMGEAGWWPGPGARVRFMAHATDAYQRGCIALSDARWAAAATDGLFARAVIHVRDAQPLDSRDSFVADSVGTVLRALGVPPDLVVEELAFARTIPLVVEWPDSATMAASIGLPTQRT